jgi:hypothetical protein
MSKIVFSNSVKNLEYKFYSKKIAETLLGIFVLVNFLKVNLLGILFVQIVLGSVLTFWGCRGRGAYLHQGCTPSLYPTARGRTA